MTTPVSAQNMPIRAATTLRTRMLLFLTLVFALLFAGLLYQMNEAERQGREQALARARELARGYVHQYDRLLRERLSLLEALLDLPGFDTLEPQRCRALLAHAVASDAALVNVVLFDGEGRPHCSARSGLITEAAAASVRHALEGRGPMVGMSGEEGQARPYLTLVRVIGHAAGRPRGALLAYVDRDWLNARFAEAVPQGVVLRIIDPDGVFVVRQPEPQCCVGKSALHLGGIGEALASGREQVRKSRWLDGIERLQADLPLSPPLAGVVSIGIPEEQVLSDSDRALARFGALLAVMSLALYALTWLYSERHILRPLRALSAGAQRLRQGEISYRIPDEGGSVEFALLRRDFNEMADTLAAREAEIRRDLEELAASEKALRENEKRLRLAARVFEQANEAIMVTDAEVTILDVNPRFTEITGYAAAEVIGRNPRILKSGRQDESFYRAMWEALTTRGHWSGEIWNRRKDGTVYPEWLSISALRDDAGRTTNYVAMFTDLTQRKAAEEALRASEQRLATLFETVPDAVFFKDGLGRWQLVNGAARRLFRLEAAAWQGKTDLELALANPEFSGEHLACWRSDEEAWAAGQLVHATEVIHRPEGGTAIFDVTRVPLYDPDGTRLGLVVVARDVTERYRAAEELERRVAERTQALEAANRELEAFSYSVSHDLRAPLRAINGFSHLLEEEYGASLDARARDYLARVRAASVRMGALIDDLLELARVTRNPIRLVEADLSAMAAEIAAELAAAEPGRKAEWIIAPGLRARCDEGLMRAALANLLGNAWKYSSRREQARIEFGAEEQQGRCVFFVRDNGAGFDMRFADKLFHPFQRLHHPAEFPGTGIGLAIVARILRRHGGDVWAEGRPDEGATFFFRLPEAKVSPGTAAPAN